MANVLVVEDDPTVSEAVVSYLERAGHTPRSVADGAQAASLLTHETVGPTSTSSFLISC